jgi:hypothetical protein
MSRTWRRTPVNPGPGFTGPPGRLDQDSNEVKISNDWAT